MNDLGSVPALRSLVRPPRKAAARAAASLLALAVLLLPAFAFAQEGGEYSQFQSALANGWISALSICFVAGLAMAATPCVWPMIPITVSIFGATESKSRWRGVGLSGTFVLGLACFFGAVGVASAFTGGAVGGFLSKWYVAVGIAVVFAALAASMFGAFEIALPSSLQNKLSTVGGVGFKGAFVLGFVMALIAAPCTTGFIAGLFVAIGSKGSVLLGFLSFAVLALGMGVPFFLVGAFAVSLPKPGAWMLGMKWLCGLVLAYMALAYLGDGFPALKKAVVRPGVAYGAIGLLVLAVGIALGGLHIAAERRRSKIAHLSKPMKLASLVPAIAGVFMVMSWAQAPKAQVVPVAAASQGGGEAPEIVWNTDEPAASARALAEKKAVIIDFGAEWCKACKELEHETFPDAKVREAAKDFVAIRIDMTDDEDAVANAAAKKYKVTAALLPAVLLLDGNGNEVKRFYGFVTPALMAEAIHKVKP